MRLRILNDGYGFRTRLLFSVRTLGKVTCDGVVSVDDMRPVLEAGVSRNQVEDALAICYAFNVTNRLANAFGLEMMTPDAFQAGAKYLLRRGYQ